MANIYAVVRLSVQHGEYNENPTYVATITDGTKLNEYGRKYAEEIYLDSEDTYEHE